MRKQMIAIGGFLLLGLGILSVILSLVGLKITMISFIYNKGVFSVVLQFTLLMAGFIMLYLSRVSPDENEELPPSAD